MTASDIHSLSEFLLHAGTDYRIFDMGRGIYPLTSQAFLELENGEQPVPRPRQQHGWFAVVFWQTQHEQHYIWFIKLPLDEQGKIIAASRNHFLQIIVDALGKQLTDSASDNNTLPDNPYSFVPTQNVMAQFSAISRLHLARPLSQGCDAVKQYLQSPAVMDWRDLPIQAIADIAVRVQEPDICALLEKQFFILHEQVQTTLLQNMESIALPESLQTQFIAHINKHKGLPEQSPLLLQLLRAISCEHADTSIQSLLLSLLNQDDTVTLDLLSIIAARHYPQLDVLLLQAFLEQCAKADKANQQDGALFEGFFSDLVQIPVLRRSVLLLLRSAQQSPDLQDAVTTLIARKNAGN